MKNWLTTVIGIATAGATIALKIKAKQPITAEDIAIAGGLIGLGAASKDARQHSTEAEVAEATAHEKFKADAAVAGR